MVPVAQGCILDQILGRDNLDYGELLQGVSGRSGWYMKAPAGMVPIPGGSFTIGSMGEDIARRINPSRQVAVSSFYMDRHAITNNQYRKFIDDLLAPNDLDDDDDNASIDESSEEDNELSDEYIQKHLVPDMTRWQKDFAHQMADPMAEEYYAHAAFDKFPVVGITWEAARFFADWRTQYLNDYREENGLLPMPRFRLATAAEWTRAARGGKEFAKYPWGGPYVRNEKGELMANFKASRGDYKGSSKYDYTSPVDHFPANGYGLHIGGNVFEWTIDAYNPTATAYTWDLNPVYHDDSQPYKITKGGSWNSIARFLQTDVVDYEHKDKARSYIGFRCVMSHIGEEPDRN